VRAVAVDGYPTDRREIVAFDDTLGMFAIDDNEWLADPALPRFVLEVRDLSIAVSERGFTARKEWSRMTTQECISLLESSGVIEGL
jgi:hypothetical protein